MINDNQHQELFDEILQAQSEKYSLVLINDNHNTFDYVIELLVKICNHDVLQAEQCAFLVHYKNGDIVS